MGRINAFINCRFYDFKTYKENQYVLFDTSIIDIGPMSDFKDNDFQIIDASNKLLMPSLVVGHTHFYSKLARGLSLPLNPHNFKEMLEQLWWKIDAQLDKKMVYHSGFVGAYDMVLNGITTVIDHHASGWIKGSLEALSDGVKAVGLRGLYCFETSDRFNIDDCIKENLRNLNSHTPKHSGLFGLHASFSLSDQTLLKVKQVIKDAPIHIHVAESKFDVLETKRLYGKTVIERLNDFNLLNKDSIIVHGIFLTDKDRDILKQNECVVALNVTSNMNNGVGIASYKKLKEKHIPVIIGNDGISSSITTEYLNLYYVNHLLEHHINGFSLSDLLDVINNTYDYVNRRLKINIGRIEPGYKADVLLHDFVHPTPVDKTNIIGHLFFGYFNAFKPSDVWVDGNHLVKDYHLSSDLTNTYQKSIQHAKRLWKRL